MYIAQSDLIKFITFLLFFLTVPTMGASSNPFQCKIPSEIKIMEETQVDNLVFKGYIIIDDIIYGIITIGDSDYEVLEGDEIKGFRILNISNIGLDYFHNQRKYHSTLDSQ